MARRGASTRDGVSLRSRLVAAWGDVRKVWEQAMRGERILACRMGPIFDEGLKPRRQGCASSLSKALPLLDLQHELGRPRRHLG